MSFIIRLDSTLLGPAAGGTRAAQCASLGEALDDPAARGCNDSENGRTERPPDGRWRRSVIALPAPRNEIDQGTWKRILTLHAENIDTLRGQLLDRPRRQHQLLGHGRAQRHNRVRLRPLRRAWRSRIQCIQHVAGRLRGNEGELPCTEDSGRSTALTVLVQGLGAVGGGLAVLASQAGARLLVSDTDPERLAWARQLGHAVVGTDDVPGHADTFRALRDGQEYSTARSSPVELPAYRSGRAPRTTFLPTRERRSSLHSARCHVRARLSSPKRRRRRSLESAERSLGWSEETVGARARHIGDTLAEVYSLAESEDGIDADRAARILAPPPDRDSRLRSA